MDGRDGPRRVFLQEKVAKRVSMKRSHRRWWLPVVWSVVAVLGSTATSCPSIPNPRPAIPGDDSIDRASAYLVSRGFDLSPAAALPLDYVRRKFGIQWADAIGEETRRRAKDPAYRAQIGIFVRMVDPDQANALRDEITDVIAEYENVPTTYALLRSIYCDWIQVDRGLVEELTESKPQMEFWPLSALMSLAYLEENGCMEPSDLQRARAAAKANFVALVDVAVARGDPLDARTVATVGGFAFAMGTEALQPRWIERLEESQRREGSWGLDADSLDDRDLATVFALLALLEHARPDTPSVPMIPRRTDRLPEAASALVTPWNRSSTDYRGPEVRDPAA